MVQPPKCPRLLRFWQGTPVRDAHPWCGRCDVLCRQCGAEQPQLTLARRLRPRRQ
jgi:hypothetical protein